MQKSGKEIKVFCTLGPSSLNEKVIRRFDELGVNLLRLNLSHVPIDQLEACIKMIRDFSDIPICLDTEGAQVRTGPVEHDKVVIQEGDQMTLHAKEVLGDRKNLLLTPACVLSQLRMGDLISIDYNTALLRVLYREGEKIQVVALYDGFIASNKGVSILSRKMKLPSLTDKDIQAIEIGSKLNIKHVALSFANGKAEVNGLRKLCGEEVFIISKIENHEGLLHLKEIILASDAILIDRGDLSKEESIVNIPFLQKMVIKKANKLNKEVYVATNLLESMVDARSPTRAEVNDVVNTLLDGADGFVLAAETAVGKHPVGSVNFIKSLIKRFHRYQEKEVSFSTSRDNPSYLLTPPHGGVLIDRIRLEEEEQSESDYDHKLVVDEVTLMDVEQIANGGFSPLSGFMTEEELKIVLKDYHLPNGEIWPMPILLQAQREQIKGFQRGQRIALVNKEDDLIYGILHLKDLYKFDFHKVALAWFQTDSCDHPGVQNVKERGEYCLGGEVDLLRKVDRSLGNYILSPRETRAIFEHKGWTKIVGFHTRNVVHRAHEYMQMRALGNYFADGLFIHPLIGPKKKHDFSSDMIIKSYEIMIEHYYPKGKVLFSVFPSYPRYAGPREAVFTALCRKNYGCTHFIVGRDHSGVGNFYKPTEAHELFQYLRGIGIEPIFFDKVHYCQLCEACVEHCSHGEKYLQPISGSRVREIFQNGRKPEDWLLREEISTMIEESMRKDKNVFVV